MADIFLSYASADRERITGLIALLEEAGYSVWWDRELVAGPGFAEMIEEQLLAARCVVVAWTDHSVKSRWCLDEASEGLARRCLVPVALDDARPPLGFRSLHTASLRNWPPADHDRRALLDGVREAIDGTATPERPGAPTGADPVPTTNERTVAVLPFQHMDEDPEQAFFCDGLAEDIITELTRIPQLMVIARDAAFALKGSTADLTSIGRQLDARYVLQGRVRRAGQRVRVSAHLEDVGTGRSLWSDRYDRTIEDAFALQDELTREIVNALDIELVSGEIGRTERARFRSARSGAVLYRAMYEFLKYERRAMRVARQHMEEFVRLEPDSSLGYALLGMQWAFCMVVGWAEPDEAMPQLLDCIDQALARDPDDPRALVAQACARVMQGDLDGAFASADRAVTLLPMHDEAWFVRGWVQVLSGNNRNAIDSLEYARRLCPILNPTRLGVLATAYRNAGRHDEAIGTLLLCLRQNPDFALFARSGLAVAYAMAGDDTAAAREVQAVLELDPGYTVSRFTTPDLYRDPAVMAQCAEALRAAGLPDG